MDASVITGLAALAGSAIGGLTSLGTSWLTNNAQARAKHRAQDKLRRQDLYKQFIEEASVLYGDALTHEAPELSKLVGLYAKVSRMRILSAETVLESAEQVVQAVVDAYLGPNHTLAELHDLIDSHMDPLKAFSEACRNEQRMLGYL